MVDRAAYAAGRCPGQGRAGEFLDLLLHQLPAGAAA